MLLMLLKRLLIIKNVIIKFLILDMEKNIKLVN